MDMMVDRDVALRRCPGAVLWGGIMTVMVRVGGFGLCNLRYGFTKLDHHQRPGPG